jgi:hypothetical protein
VTLDPLIIDLDDIAQNSIIIFHHGGSLSRLSDQVVADCHSSPSRGRLPKLNLRNKPYVIRLRGGEAMDAMHQRCAGLDVHKEMIVACIRIMVGAKVSRECRTFDTSTSGLLASLAWLSQSGCSHVAMEATGVYWKPVRVL